MTYHYPVPQVKMTCGHANCRWNFEFSGSYAQDYARRAYREHLRLVHGTDVDEESKSEEAADD